MVANSKSPLALLFPLTTYNICHIVLFVVVVVVVVCVGQQQPRPWGLVLGQSYGGFCVMTYLATIPNPPKICLLTGGIAPMLTPLQDVYMALWNQCRDRNMKYYDMYPGDIRRVKQIVQSLLQQPVPLPSGGILTARRLLQLGIALGGSPSTFASFHSMLSTATVSTNKDNDNNENLVFTRAFLKYIDTTQSFDDHPIYFWLHESCYANGPTSSPTNWAAHSVYETLVAQDKAFDYQYTSSLMDDNTQPTLFFGEHVFPFMVDDYAELSGVGLGQVAHRLATKTDWKPLYNADQMRKVLSATDGGICKAAAAVYVEDMYVWMDASLKVAARGGPLEQCKVWITNEYQHSGLRDNGAAIFTKLFGMATGSIQIPS